MKRSFSLTIFLLLTCGHAFAQTAVISVPIDIEFKQLFSAGTSTYLAAYVSPELDRQIEESCGRNGRITAMNVHYTIKKFSSDTNDVKMTGKVECFPMKGKL